MSLQLADGQILALLGPSGGGKTTLIKCIYGLEDLQGGEILFDGEQVLGPAYNLMPGHKSMKLVSQDYYVLDNHTVEENIKDILIGYTNEFKAQRSEKLLGLLELGALRHVRARDLSSGQKQRVAIARALVDFPKLLLLDEPFSNLDKILKDKLFDFIMKETKKNNGSALLITHHAEEALEYAGTIGVIVNGKIIQLGEKEEVYYRPKNSRIARLMGDYNTLSVKDLNASSVFRKGAKKLMLRPNQFELVKTKLQSDLEVSYINHFFNGKCVEVLAETAGGSQMIFYCSKAPKILDRFFLKITTFL